MYTYISAPPDSHQFLQSLCSPLSLVYYVPFTLVSVLSAWDTHLPILGKASSFLSFRSQLKCYFLKEAFLGH